MPQTQKIYTRVPRVCPGLVAPAQSMDNSCPTSRCTSMHVSVFVAFRPVACEILPDSVVGRLNARVRVSGRASNDHDMSFSGRSRDIRKKRTTVWRKATKLVGIFTKMLYRHHFMTCHQVIACHQDDFNEGFREIVYVSK